MIDSLIYDKDENSQYVGDIGEKITRYVTCERVINLMGYYGPSTMFTFYDDEGNVFVWTTTSEKQEIEENGAYIISGRVKDHRMYKNCCQTVLTRCRVCAQ
ncbi:MAG: hypothetical protein II411_04435 [Lachnospiraceae bacterium]|nr:hypothetical protein [Lachnospiraceae bacterium]